MALGIETSSHNAKTLDDLRARYDCPLIKYWRLQILRCVPEDKFAGGSCDDPTQGLAAPHRGILIDVSVRFCCIDALPEPYCRATQVVRSQRIKKSSDGDRGACRDYGAS